MAGGFATTLYNGVFKRSSTFALAAIVGAFFVERITDITANTIFESVNKGKLWKDIKGQYE
ncbi:ubiquinol-cytochrome C reductase complex subunit oxen [Dermacentor variabilis]|uniref:ubiquinol-cytochrome C reductase complex subunit oxen n=1 Tax=Dermacentor variabilis TaxID=34621 RepID=UPI003F5BF7FE